MCYKAIEKLKTIMRGIFKCMSKNNLRCGYYWRFEEKQKIAEIIQVNRIWIVNFISSCIYSDIITSDIKYILYQLTLTQVYYQLIKTVHHEQDMKWFKTQLYLAHCHVVVIQFSRNKSPSLWFLFSMYISCNRSQKASLLRFSPHVYCLGYSA